MIFLDGKLYFFQRKKTFNPPDRRTSCLAWSASQHDSSYDLLDEDSSHLRDGSCPDRWNHQHHREHIQHETCSLIYSFFSLKITDHKYQYNLIRALRKISLEIFPSVHT